MSQSVDTEDDASFLIQRKRGPSDPTFTGDFKIVDKFFLVFTSYRSARTINKTKHYRCFPLLCPRQRARGGIGLLIIVTTRGFY